MILLVVLALACYRVTRFIIDDTLIDRQRDWVFRRTAGHPKIHELLDCPYCVSIWVAAGMVAGADLVTSVPLPLLTWLATSGGALVAWKFIEVEDDE